MIRTTMEHKSGRTPGLMAKNIPGKPSSQNVIRTSVKKTGGGHDQFVYRKSGCAEFQGGPDTSIQD